MASNPNFHAAEGFETDIAETPPSSQPDGNEDGLWTLVWILGRTLAAGLGRVEEPSSSRPERRMQSAPGRDRGGGGHQRRESPADGDAVEFERGDGNRQSAGASRHYMKRALARSGVRSDAFEESQGGGASGLRSQAQTRRWRNGIRKQPDAVPDREAVHCPVREERAGHRPRRCARGGRGGGRDGVGDRRRTLDRKQLLEGREIDEILRLVELNHQKFDPLDVSFCVMHLRRRVNESGSNEQRAALKAKLLGDERLMLLTLLAAKFAPYIYRFSFLYMFRDLLHLFVGQFPKRPPEVFLEVATSNVNKYSIRQLCSSLITLLEYRLAFKRPLLLVFNSTRAPVTASPTADAATAPARPTTGPASATANTVVTNETPSIKSNESAEATLAANVSKLHAALLESLRLAFRERRPVAAFVRVGPQPRVRVRPLQKDAQMHRFLLEILLDEGNRLEHNRQLADRLHVSGLLPAVFSLVAIAESVSVAHEPTANAGALLPSPDDVHTLFLPLSVKDYAGPPLYQTVARKFLGFLERNGESLVAWESGIARRLHEALRGARLAAADGCVSRSARLCRRARRAEASTTSPKAAAHARRGGRTCRAARALLPAGRAARDRPPARAAVAPHQEFAFEQNLALLECAIDAGAAPQNTALLTRARPL